MKDFI